MPVYLSMLRGINVSGQKKVPMAELRVIFEDLGFGKVRTYIQSGNVIFQAAAKDPKALSEKISKAIKKHFGFDVAVLIRDLKQMEAVLKKNPYLRDAAIDTARLYVTFLHAAPETALSKKLESVDFTPDSFVIDGDEIYLHCPVSYGNSKLSNNYFENKLKVTGTTRNWRTVNELYRMMQE